ncbi:MAG: hypothetical protein AB1671_25170 [Thermodesulfobacteriota bacterium]|jgi:hypothetical protein
MRYDQTAKTLLLVTFVGLLAWGCGEKQEMGPKEQQAIQLVRAYTPEGGVFSVISNIEKAAEVNARQGNKWELGPWEAGLPSQKDRIVEELSQYFNIFRPAGDYWVRFTYKDKDGVHEALWDVNIYTKKVVAKNEVAQQFTAPTS